MIKGVWKETKIRIYKIIVDYITLYVTEVWEIIDQIKQKFKAMEMNFWWHSCELTFQGYITNETIKA